MVRMSETQIGRVFTTADSIDHNEYVIIHYKIVPRQGLTLDEVAAIIALNTSLGTIRPLPYETEAERFATQAKVLSTTNMGSCGYVRIAYPIDLCGITEGIPQLLNVIWYASEFIDTTSLWVDNIDLPMRFIKQSRGPRFGIPGIRERIGIESRPLFGTNTKPRRGVSLRQIVDACYESLLGGADYVMDDELIVDPAGDLAFRHRVPAMVEVVRKARGATRQTKWYIANVTASPKRAYEYAKFAIEAGADALLANAFTMGYAAFAELAEDSEIDVPIINCGLGAGILTRPPYETGTADVVLSKLSRICGADAAYTGCIGTELWYTQEVLRPTVVALRNPLHGLKPSMPVGAGGLTIANLWQGISFLGPDVILLAGRGILGFPGGPRKGASAFRHIVENIPYDLSREEGDKKVVDLARRHDFTDGLRYYGFRPLATL
jgi:2,3-diketo-5-methylthiopentyl-1-phosphate enolase